MALDVLQSAETINLMENFIDKRRPPAHLRAEVDLSYKIEKQSVIIFEIRPNWMNRKEMMESPIAKATWVHTQNIWKVYWMRADLKWHGYDPVPTTKTLEEFLDVVGEDRFGCFWG